jgi:hypothetical protein
LIPVGKDPVGAHGAQPVLRRGAVSWKAE